VAAFRNSEDQGVRVALAIGQATLAVPLAVAVFLMGIAIVTGQDWRVAVTGVYMFGVVATPVALLVTVCAGAPLGARLAKRGRLGWTHFVKLGMVLGAVPLLVFDLYIAGYEIVRNGLVLGRLMNYLPDAFTWLVLGAWCGGWSAMAYWAAAYRGRTVPS
jgi:hypothetical protein